MMIPKAKSRTIIVLFALVAISAASVYFFSTPSLASGMSGAIYTSTFNGQSVNENHYSNKEAVYVNGGPQNEDIEGLPDGTYYFQVTNPSGSVLLSTDPASCRQLIVANGKVAAAEGPACQHATGIPNSSNGSTPVQLAPFADSPNNGGEYKVWLIRQTSNTSIAPDGMHLIFKNSDAKTDNFKVIFAPCTNCNPNSTLSGKKFYDGNTNGLLNEGEGPVQGVQISIEVTVGGVTSSNLVTTDESGNWSLVVPTGAIYSVGEFLPGTGPDQQDSHWVQTAPVADGEGFQGYGGTANGDQSGLDFGNVCVGANGVVSTTPCSVSYEPPPTPTPTPEPTPTATPCTDCPTSTVSGRKYYDANHNGAFDEGEATIQGVRIAVILTTGAGTVLSTATTNADGNWSLVVETGADYIIGEFLPDTDPEVNPDSYWEQTAPAADDEGFRGYRGTISGDLSGLDFGDICFSVDSEGNPSALSTPCSVRYPVTEPTPTPEPTATPTPDNW